MCNTNARSLFLIIVGTLLVMIGIYVTNPPADVTSWFIGTLSDVTQLLLILVPALLLISCRTLKWVVRRIQPKPGDRPLPAELNKKLIGSFKGVRWEIGQSLVPRHAAAAKPAKSSTRIDLGDAALVLSKKQKHVLQEFVGSPRRRSRSHNGNSRSLERDVLIVTGEPGSGKSVLLQELYQTLSLGVEKEYHAFIPVFVFAREIRSIELEQALGNEHPMQHFLRLQLSERRQFRSNEYDWSELQQVVQGDWDNNDFLIIIDGLDEIPQRSQYESIQRSLQTMIEKDVKPREARSGTHRYILSCRIDEDIKVFSGALVLNLQGLTERQIDQYCEAQLDRLDKDDRAMVRELLRSNQLIPSHVFRRNPYFLALLTKYFDDTRTSVREQSLDFGFLMERYLDREARRDYASAQQQLKLIQPQEKDVQSLKDNAWPFLYASAFRAVISPQEGTVYRETGIKPMIESILRDVIFDSESKDEVPPEHGDDWSWLRQTLLENASAHPSDSDKSDPLRSFRDLLSPREMIPLIGKRLRRDGVCEESILYAIEDLTRDQHLEDPIWYRGLASEYARILKGLALDESQNLASVFLFRSMVAAQLLRVIYVHNPGGDYITFRFRHRRLAEYFAARYCLDRWDVVQGMIQPLPWLGPVLNLVCALQSTPNHALMWLIDEISEASSGPNYEWRNSVEIACEAISFARVDKDFDGLFAKLVIAVFHPLLSTEEVQESIADDAKNMPDISGHVVTRILLHRKLGHLSLLARAIKRKFAIDMKSVNAFFSQTRAVEPEWLSYHVASCRALEEITGLEYPRRHKFHAMRQFITNPASLLFTTSERRNDRLQTPRRVARATTILGEAICWVVWFGILFFCWLTVDVSSSSNDVFIREFSQIVVGLLAFLWVLWRPAAILRTPSKAVFLSSLPWRLSKWFLIFALALLVIAGLSLGVVWAHGVTVRVLLYSIRLSHLLGLLALALPLLTWLIIEIRHQGLRSVARSIANYVAVIGMGLVFLGLCSGSILLVGSLFPSQPNPPDEAQPVTAVTITDKNWDRMERLAQTSISPDPDDNLLGTIEAMFIERSANRTISQIREARVTLRDALKTAEDAEKNRMTEMDAKLTETQTGILQVRDNLRPRNRRLLTRLVAALAVAVALGAAIRVYKQSSRDKKISDAISKNGDIASLVTILQMTSHSEQVRRKALRKIDGIERFDEAHQRIVEQAADTLYRSIDQTERQLGLEVAALAASMSKRLQYRKATGQVTKE